MVLLTANRRPIQRIMHHPAPPAHLTLPSLSTICCACSGVTFMPLLAIMRASVSLSTLRSMPCGEGLHGEAW